MNASSPTNTNELKLVKISVCVTSRCEDEEERGRQRIDGTAKPKSCTNSHAETIRATTNAMNSHRARSGSM